MSYYILIPQEMCPLTEGWRAMKDGRFCLTPEQADVYSALFIEFNTAKTAIELSEEDFIP